MACQQLPHPNDDGYDGDGGGRGRERGREGGRRRTLARSLARPLVAVYGLRQIVVAFVGIATAAAPAALLSEIRRVIARLRLHLPARCPLAAAYMLFPLSLLCARAFLCLSCFKTQLSLSCVAIWLLKSPLNGERPAPSSVLSCLSHACSHRCTYIYSCLRPPPPSLTPRTLGPFRTIVNDFRPSSSV